MAEQKDRCQSYLSGHQVHPIQARLCWEDPGEPVRAIVDDNGWITIEHENGETERVWTHDRDRVAGLLADSGGNAVRRSHAALSFPHPGGAAYVSIGTNPSPCPTEPLIDASLAELVELVAERGGFLARIDPDDPNQT